ncbi:hypothetical protein AJ79_05393 [Helicocarpus griseus UAMH5409]|uniref:MFS maltose permease n=1 Tax=Helicocarpus griseus UAMH5409 TaxID=1447875 RepID=A0A2B7XP84_9EURO|nr:hypothetical protein AJ79_05393 [Helicocarpus griseus UAMH5409]
MLSPQLPRRRIPTLLRPLRPPRTTTSTTHHPPTPRFFTINTPQRIITSPTRQLRPQLPFLHSPTTAAAAGGIPISSNPFLNAALLRLNIPRLISTERQAYYQKIYRGVKICLTVYVAIVLLFIIREGFTQENYERLFPTPPEWSFLSRWKLRTARAKQHPEMFNRLRTNWSAVGEYYKELIARLEDPNIDGEGIREQEEGGFLIDGVGKAGYDIEGMSEAWKIGYFQALMGAGEAAEKLDGWMRDTVQDIVGPPDAVIRTAKGAIGGVLPTPLPGRKMLKEEDSVPAYERPEVFYMKVLTTKGFGTQQKLDAALAYADWLDFKGLDGTAGDVYRWAMDIAAAGLGGDVDAGRVVDRETGVLNEKGNAFVTENILRTSTALGVHQVRRGDLSKALSIFVSVLRARRGLPAVEQPAAITDPEFKMTLSKTKKPYSLTDLPRTIVALLTLLEYPLPTRTGNEPAVRSPYTACEEAGLMVYIGEILYASSSQERGLAWTRDAVDLAESTILQLNDGENADDLATAHFANPSSMPLSVNHADAHQRCRDCVKAGLDNWKTMVRKLVVKAENEELESLEKVGEGWFGSGKRRVREREMERRRWEAEEMLVKDRANRLRYILGNPGFSEYGMSIILG